MAAVIESFRTTLRVLGRCVAEIGTPYCIDFEQQLLGLVKRLSNNLSAEETGKIAAEADAFIEEWGRRIAEESRAKTADIKSLLLALAYTAQATGNHDHVWTTQLEDLTKSLASAAALDDISQIKASLAGNIAQLKSSAGQMNRESEEIVQQLKQQISIYEERLELAEAIGFRDSLTGLANRRRIEQQIERSVQRGETFCLVMLDINRFKPVNDEFGHNAGDNLLRQFSKKLEASTSAGNLLGRWGGDEFIVVLVGSMSASHSYIERVKKTVFGKYRVTIEENSFGIDLHVDASIGVAEWSSGETMDQLVARADANMYEGKTSNRKSR